MRARRGVGRLGAALCALTAACGTTSPTSSGPTDAPLPAGKGAVTGGIEPCAGMIGPTASPGYAAGTVVVFRATPDQGSGRSGAAPSPFPTVVVDQQSVPANGTFRFLLDPGTYVLQAHYGSGSAVVPTMQVTVVAGGTLHRDFPNRCI